MGGGAGKWRQSDWQPLAGKSTVIIADFPADAPLENPNVIDRPGQTYALQIAEQLHELGCAVRVVIPKPAAGEDVGDWIAQMGAARVRDFVIE